LARLAVREQREIPQESGEDNDVSQTSQTQCAAKLIRKTLIAKR
jgi:hypothetical protein